MRIVYEGSDMGMHASLLSAGLLMGAPGSPKCWLSSPCLAPVAARLSWPMCTGTPVHAMTIALVS